MTGIWSSGYQIYITSDFEELNNCGPTAATNLVYYWAHYGSPKESSLWTGQVYGDLEKYMNYEWDTGTSNSDILPGIEQFSNSRNVEIAGSNEDGTDWDTFESRMNSNYPVIVTIYNDPNYGGTGYGHAMVGVGYQDTSDGNYIRVADGASRTFSNFYKQSDYLVGNYCVWW